MDNESFETQVPRDSHNLIRSGLEGRHFGYRLVSGESCSRAVFCLEILIQNVCELGSINPLDSDLTPYEYLHASRVRQVFVLLITNVLAGDQSPFQR